MVKVGMKYHDTLWAASAQNFLLSPKPESKPDLNFVPAQRKTHYGFYLSLLSGCQIYQIKIKEVQLNLYFR